MCMYSSAGTRTYDEMLAGGCYAALGGVMRKRLALQQQMLRNGSVQLGSLLPAWALWLSLVPCGTGTKRSPTGASQGIPGRFGGMQLLSAPALHRQAPHNEPAGVARKAGM